MPTPASAATNYKAGLGLMYDITDSLAVRAEAERYRIKDAVGNKGHVDMLSVGLIYRFGATQPLPPRPPASWPLPAPAASRLRRRPPAAVTHPRRRPMRVTLSADSLFDFDKSVVKPAGRQALDKLAADLRGISYDLSR